MCDLGRHLFIVRFDPHLSVRAPKYTHTHSDTTIVFHSREIQFSSIYFSENFERHRQRTASASNRNIFVFASFHFAISFNMELIRNEIAATHSPHTRWPIHTITVTFVSRCTHHCHTMRHLDKTMSTNAISTKNSIFECQRFGPINYRIDTMRGDGKKGISMKKSVRNLLRANEWEWSPQSGQFIWAIFSLIATNLYSIWIRYEMQRNWRIWCDGRWATSPSGEWKM